MAWVKEVSKPRDDSDRPNFVGALTIMPSFLMALTSKALQIMVRRRADKLKTPERSMFLGKLTVSSREHS